MQLAHHQLRVSDQHTREEFQNPETVYTEDPVALPEPYKTCLNVDCRLSSTKPRSKFRLAGKARNALHSLYCSLSNPDRFRCHLNPLSSLPSDSKNRIRTRGRCNGNLSSCRGSFSSTCWCLRGSQGAKKSVRGGVGAYCNPKPADWTILQSSASGRCPWPRRLRRRYGNSCLPDDDYRSYSGNE